jgi:hypothetical protein
MVPVAAVLALVEEVAMKRTLAALFLLILPVAILFGQDQKNERPALKAVPREALRAAAGGDSQEAVEKLPVRRVVLYKNGVGYFEHLGHVRGSQDVHIDFTSAQLNDVLKSLTVLDLDGGRISGVDYNSEAPLARRLATLRLALGERPTVSEFLGALRGARVEVRSATGPAMTGKLLSVERKTRNATNWTVETDEISVIGDTGEVRTVDLNPTTSVRIIEKDLQLEVSKYLALIASSRDQDVRRMTISTAGTGERKLYVSYISEVPIWKTTYRIVLPAKSDKKPLLQGWAIVDNTVGEDWNDVELSLVAGAPHSFIQQLSEPFYGRRPVVDLPESVELSPQTHASALSGGNGILSGTITDASGAVLGGAAVTLRDENSNIVEQTTADSAGRYTFSSLAAGNYRLETDARGFKKSVFNEVHVAPGENVLNAPLEVGATTETVEVSAGGNAQMNTDSASPSTTNGLLRPVAKRAHLSGGSGVGTAYGGTGGGSFRAGTGRSVEDARTLGVAAANGQELGDLFEYKLKDRVSLKKNQSALVPIAQTEIAAEKVSLWNGASVAGRPLRALWLTNTSSLTLDGGSFSVLENEVFAGEGLTDPIKPGDRRLLSYATDLSLLVDAQKATEPQHITRVKISKGVLTQMSELHAKTVYTVKNQDGTARTLIIEHPARAFATLVPGSVAPEERAAGVYRYKMEVAGKATSTLPVEEIQPLEQSFQLTNVNDEQIAVFVKNGTITGEMAAALKKITEQKTIVAGFEQEMEDRQGDIDRIVEDQGRLRENMKALRGSAEEKALLQRYTRQLDEQETQLEALRKKIKDTEAQRDLANEKLEKMIGDLQLEATL